MVMTKLFVLIALITGGNCVNFIIKNKEGGPIWVGILGNNGKSPLANGGFVLESGAEVTHSSDDHWAGRFWPRTWCDSNSKHCETGDCGNKLQCAGAGGVPPVTLVEITLRGAGGLDFYDVSLVDGYNIKASIEPVGGKGDGSKYSCKNAACNSYINDVCPNELKQIGQSAGYAIACKSACLAFNTDQYCCRGNYNTPQTCRSRDWPVNYPAFFKRHCPDAYSYAYDDEKSTFTCIANTYRITFG